MLRVELSLPEACGRRIPSRATQPRQNLEARLLAHDVSVLSRSGERSERDRQRFLQTLIPCDV